MQHHVVLQRQVGLKGHAALVALVLPLRLGLVDVEVRLEVRHVAEQFPAKLAGYGLLHVGVLPQNVALHFLL